MITDANSREYSGAVRVTSAPPACRSSPHRPLPVWRLAGALGLVIAGLWAIQIVPSLAAMLLPLNVLTASVTAVMLDAIGLPVTRELNLLTHASGFAGEIDFTCTALAPAVLLGAVVFAWPASWRARFLAALAAVSLMILLNQLRLVTLVSVGVFAPHGFNVAHLLVWPALMLITAFSFLVFWARSARP